MTVSSRVCLFTLLGLLIGLSAGPVMARNPFSNYLSRLLDESKAEMAIGKILFEGLETEVAKTMTLTRSEELSRLALGLAARTQRPTLPYAVYLLDSQIPGEIPLPGGTIVLTKGLLALSKHRQLPAFLVGRNVAHIARRHPMKLVKQEGLYAPLLKLVKMPAARRDQEDILELFRRYAKAGNRMDQLLADQDAIAMSRSPDELRKVVATVLKHQARVTLPFVPLTMTDLPARAEALSRDP